MLGGPIMNLVIGAVLITGVITLYGLAAGRAQGRPPLQVRADGDATRSRTRSPTCAAGDPPPRRRPAAFQEKDRILAINGQPIDTWDQVSAAIRENAGKEMSFLVRRGETDVTLKVTPAVLERATYDEEGNPITKDGRLVLQPMGFMGITPGQELVTASLAEAPGSSGPDPRHRVDHPAHPREDGRRLRGGLRLR